MGDRVDERPFASVAADDDVITSPSFEVVEPPKSGSDRSSGSSPAGSKRTTSDEFEVPEEVLAVRRPVDARAGILVVDDEEFLAKLLVRRLENLGFRGLVATSGEEALEIIASSESGVVAVLLDEMMPGLSGLETLRRIRERWDHDTVTVIMHTARDDREIVLSALEAGADDFVTKPADLPILVARLEGRLTLRRTLDALHRSRERFALAAKGANDGLWDVDARTGDLFVSERFGAILGLAAGEEPLGLRSWLERIHPADRARVAGAFRRHLDGELDVLQVEHRVVDSGGDQRWVLVRGACVRDDRGRVFRIAGSLTDLSRSPEHDAETGLPTRRIFLARVRAALARPGTTAVISARLSGLREVDDESPELALSILREASRRLEASVAWMGHREGVGDAARLDGAGFAVVVGGLDDPVHALRIARSILEALDHPYLRGERALRLPARIGVAVGAGRASAELLLKRSKEARRRAGPAPACILFDPARHRDAAEQIALEEELDRAVDARALSLRYQPIVDLATGETVAVEAFLSWPRAEGREVGPSEFVPWLERSGRIVEVGAWALAQACAAVVARDADQPGCRLAMNVSVQELEAPGWTDRVFATLDAAGLAAERLEIELPETGVSATEPAALAALDTLRACGARISLDAFGTGSTSMAHLRTMRIDALKIDRRFVAGLGARRDDAAIVAATVAMARELGLVVIAEGVETAGQYAYLRAAGCDHAQGRWIGAPSPTLPSGSGIQVESGGGQ